MESNIGLGFCRVSLVSGEGFEGNILCSWSVTWGSKDLQPKMPDEVLDVSWNNHVLEFSHTLSSLHTLVSCWELCFSANDLKLAHSFINETAKLMPYS